MPTHIAAWYGDQIKMKHVRKVHSHGVVLFCFFWGYIIGWIVSGVNLGGPK